MAIAHTQHVKEEKPSSHGVKYLIDGTISSPIGKSVKVITVWIIDKGQSRPRFITAYPG